VSLEGLPGGPQCAVLRAALALAPSIAHVADDTWALDPDFATSCAELLRRARAWKGLLAGHAGAAVCLGAWLPIAPSDPLLAGVYARVAGDLLPRGARHVMVRLHSDPHEAFDAAIAAGADAKHVSLRQLFAAATRLGRADAGLGLPTEVLDVVAPPRADDTPREVARLAALVAARCT
jgi:hypothetical protein